MKRSTFVRKTKRVQVSFADDNDDDSVDSTSTSTTSRDDGSIGAKHEAAATSKRSSSSSSLLRGTKVSVANGLTVTSTGLADLDRILGGGLPLSSLLLLEEDLNCSHYEALLKYFLAHGVVTGHAVCLVAPQLPHEPLEYLLHHLPRTYGTASARGDAGAPRVRSFRPSSNHDDEQDEYADDDDDDAADSSAPRMKIAWRYEEQLAKMKPSGASDKAFSVSFDLSKNMEPTDTQRQHLHAINVSELLHSSHQTIMPISLLYREILRQIQQLLTVYKRDVEQRRVVRLVVRSLGSPLYGAQSASALESDKALLQFVYALHRLIKSETVVPIVCYLSLPVHLHSSALLTKLAHLCDNAIAIESFKGESDHQVSEAFQQYEGKLHLRKLPPSNALHSFRPETLGYVFARKRRKMEIEVFHLPPELSRTSEQPSAATSNKSGGSIGKALCQPGPPSKANPLDF